MKGFQWADGSAPFSAASCRRAERFHGVAEGSIGVGGEDGFGGEWVADELIDGKPVNKKYGQWRDKWQA